MVPTHMSSEAAVSTGSDQTTIVELHLPAELTPRGAQVAGDFTAWTPISMPPSADGNHYCIALRLPCGRAWRYRFLVDGDRWMNDLTADDYVLGPNGEAMSVRYT